MILEFNSSFHLKESKAKIETPKSIFECFTDTVRRLTLAYSLWVVFPGILDDVSETKKTPSDHACDPKRIGRAQ